MPMDLDALRTRLTAAIPRPWRRRIMALPYRLRVLRNLSGVSVRECPLCDYVGRFGAFGHPPVNDAECKRCGSLARHRLFFLALTRWQLIPDGADVIHFAPEPVITALIKPRTRYRTADLRAGRADLTLDIERLALGDDTTDCFIANHVLEHVDDRKALVELFRTLKPGGILIATLPIVEGWDVSYENPAITAPRDRAIHFGRHDHVRHLSRDFRDRVRDAGFDLREFVADGPDTVRYGLAPGERVFVATKPRSGI